MTACRAFSWTTGGLRVETRGLFLSEVSPLPNAWLNPPNRPEADLLACWPTRLFLGDKRNGMNSR